eukprot:3452562-Rhodomonas_salina.1
MSGTTARVCCYALPMRCPVLRRGCWYQMVLSPPPQNDATVGISRSDSPRFAGLAAIQEVPTPFLPPTCALPTCALPTSSIPHAYLLATWGLVPLYLHRPPPAYCR